MKPASAVFLSCIAFTVAPLAHAVTTTGTFQVLITIAKACSVTAGPSSYINLGTVNSSATNTTGNGTISVNCSKTTPYFIGLAPSNANTAGQGTMATTAIPPTNTDKVPYQLYQNSAGTTVWGNTATSTAAGNGVAGTGTGAAQTYTVYATAPGANFTPDSYADTVTVNVNY